MGDFSIPCVLSGLPIASGQKVVGFHIRKARYEDAELPFAPVGQPFRGLMGDYGRVDDQPEPPEEQDKAGRYTVHAHAKLYASAASIFRRAMPKPGSLWAEMLNCQQEYAACVIDYRKLGPDEPLERIKTICSTMHLGRLASARQPWLGLTNHLLLCVSDSETFKTELLERAWALVLGVPEGGSFDAAKSQIDEIQELMCVFAATRITGRPIRPHGYTFEQYPTFKWENKWHQDVANLCDGFYNKEIKRQKQEEDDE